MSAFCFLSVFSGCKSDNVNGVKMSEQCKKRGILCLTFDDFSGENWLKADEIFKKYNSQRAICNFTKTVKCPKCELSDLYEFNNLSTFFPQSWSV